MTAPEEMHLTDRCGSVTCAHLGHHKHALALNSVTLAAHR